MAEVYDNVQDDTLPKRLKRLRSHNHRGSIAAAAAAAAAAHNHHGSFSAAGPLLVGGSPTPNLPSRRPALRHVSSSEEKVQLVEMIFLRDLHFGFLPDDCETEFADCFAKLADDAKFANKCFRFV